LTETPNDKNDDDDDKDFDLPSELVDRPESEVKIPDTNEQGK
jgi:hypothetical protein